MLFNDPTIRVLKPLILHEFFTSESVYITKSKSPKTINPT